MATTIFPGTDELPALRISATTERVVGDVRLMAGAGYALLLQVAHPVVSAGVAEHSDFAADPWGRLIRTLDYLNVSVFGGPEAAATMGRRTREMHKQIKGLLPDGRPYHSLDPEPFAWVHATLVHALLEVAARFGRPPTPGEREAVYADWRRVGRHIGVRERDLPETYSQFRAYVARMELQTLRDTESVRDVLRALADPVAPPAFGLGPGPWRAARWPAVRAARLSTLGLLGPALRDRLDLEWSRADQLQFGALAAAHRATTPLLPGPAREFGRTYLRWRSDTLRRQGIPV